MIRTFLILIVLCVTLNVPIIGMESKSDSIITLLQDMPDDTSQLKVLITLTSNDVIYDQHKKLIFIKELLALSKKLNHNNGKLISLERLAHYYYLENKLDSALYYFKIADEAAEQSSDKTYLTILYSKYSLAYLSIAKYYKSIELGYYSLELAKQSNNDIAMGAALATLGNIYLKISNYPKSIEYTERALHYHTQLNNLFEINENHYVLGKAFCKINNKKKALFHFQTILNNQLSDNLEPKGSIIYLQGQVLALKGNYNGAMDRFETAIELMRNTNNNRRVTEVLLNIIEMYVEIIRNGQSTSFTDNSINRMGFRNFEEFARSSYKTMKEWNENDIRISTLLSLMEYYRIKQDMKQAYEYGNEYISLKDSLYKIDNAKAIAEQQFYFELDQNEKQIELLNLQNNANEEKIKAIKQQQYAYLGSVVLLIIIILVIRSRIKMTRRVRDLLKTKNKILERERIKSNLSEKFKEEFLANVSHEIRTPMNAIMGITNILLKNKHTEEQTPYLEAMNSSSKDLLVLVNDILDLSKLEAGKMNVLQLPFNPREIINSIYDNLIGKAAEKGIVLKISVGEDIPNTIIGDSKMLHQILINLLRNGISFTDQGSVELKCNLAENLGNEGILRFIVLDTGAGIIHEKQEKILNTFVKVYDKNAINYDGSGLELAIIKQMVELQGGKIRLKSAPAIGTTFFVEIPYKFPGKEYVVENLNEIESSFDLNATTILLVEDNEFNIMVAKEELETTIEKVKIDVAENGSIAIEKIKTNEYDIILMDVQMPKMNGYEATKFIRNLEGSKSNIPIIAMTANNTRQEIQNCYKAGMDEYISKPFDTSELIEKIRKLIVSRVPV